MSLRVAITGSSGRMGQTLLEAVMADVDFALYAALDQPSLATGGDAGASFGKLTGVHITQQLEALQGADVLIDFTRPAASLIYLETCVAYGVNMVIGTTGFSDAEKQIITRAAQHIAIVFAPNMSVGVNLLIKLVELTARTLGRDYDIEIIETHHRHKVDAPSGTALRLGEVAAQASGRTLPQDAVYGRQNGERVPHSIGFASLRGGDVVGDHTVMFAGHGERLELTHKASSRDTFALGALHAAKFLQDKNKGLFDMQDVLDVKRLINGV